MPVLDGLRMLDLSTGITGSYLSKLFVDAGADVVKVEPPSGDILRHMGGLRGLSPTFATTNRSKRSAVLDLKRPGALEALKRLVARADVFVQNNRPGAAERIGAGEKALREVNPKLIYVSISGFGETGPFSHKRVYDSIIQGMSGLADIQGGVKGPPRRALSLLPSSRYVCQSRPTLLLGLGRDLGPTVSEAHRSIEHRSVGLGVLAVDRKVAVAHELEALARLGLG